MYNSADNHVFTALRVSPTRGIERVFGRRDGGGTETEDALLNAGGFTLNNGVFQGNGSGLTQLSASNISGHAATITGNEAMPAEPSAGAPQKIALNTVIADSDGWWNITQKRYIPQLPGRYLVTAYFNGTATGSGGSAFWDLQIIKNGGSTNVSWLNRLPSSSAYGPNMVATAQVVCNGSTDYIELWGGQGNGGAIPGNERLEITYLGSL